MSQQSCMLIRGKSAHVSKSAGSLMVLPPSSMCNKSDSPTTYRFDDARHETGHSPHDSDSRRLRSAAPHIVRTQTSKNSRIEMLVPALQRSNSRGSIPKVVVICRGAQSRLEAQRPSARK